MRLAVGAFLQQGLLAGVVAGPGWQRPDKALLERDPLPPDFQPPPGFTRQAGPWQRIGVTQASEDEYRGVLEDTGVEPQVIWRWKYYRPGVWDGSGEARAFDHYAAGLHRRAYGNTLWAARFASSAEAQQSMAKIAAAAKLARHGAAWQGNQPSYGFGNTPPGPLTLWQHEAWVLMSTVPGIGGLGIRGWGLAMRSPRPLAAALHLPISSRVAQRLGSSSKGMPAAVLKVCRPSSRSRTAYVNPSRGCSCGSKPVRASAGTKASRCNRRCAARCGPQAVGPRPGGAAPAPG